MKKLLLFSLLTLLPASSLWAQNLIRRPDFGTAGNVAAAPADFTTQLTLNQNNSSNSGQYVVLADPGQFNGGFSGKPDHTVGGSPGALLAVDGPTSASANLIWQQVVAVQANQAYTFSYWQRNLVSTNPALLQLQVNGANVGTAFQVAAGDGGWEQVQYTLSSGSSTQLTISLLDTRYEADGNDFGLDDMSLTLQNAGAITGTVFEDVNYGGGSGRPLATASSSAAASGLAAAITRPQATVELYDSGGNYLATTTTNGDGQYTFAGVAAGSYVVRVVSGTVTSARPGAGPGLLPVQTFRTTNGSNDGNRVGGENPALADALANTNAAPLAATTGNNVTLSFVGTSTSGDNTLFMDNVEVLQGGTALATNPLANPGFESGALSGGDYQYNPSGADLAWTFSSSAGIQTNNSAFTPPNTPSGARAGFVQGTNGTNGTVSQRFSLPMGTYTIRFQAANRGYGGQQTINVLVNGTPVLASLQAAGTYGTYQTAAFTVGAAQSIAPVAVSGTATTAGVDFGFSFDVVVNTNATGQGSLQQFILNANALGGESMLAQAGYYLNELVGANPITTPLPAATETSIFMVPSGAARPGLLAYNNTATGGPASQLTNGVAVFSPSSAQPLPAITGPATAINGWTQAFNLTNTNSVTMGAGGTTGTDGAVLPQVNGPEVQLTGTAAVPVGLDVAAAATGSSIRGLAIYGFGSVADNDGNANVRIAASQVRVQGTVVGSAATSFAAPSGGSRADGIRATGGTGLIISNNLIGFHAGKGLTIRSGATGASITENEVRSNASGSSAWAGLDLQGSAATIANNLIINNAGAGLDGYASAGSNTWLSNTVSGNGRGTTANAPGTTPGVRLAGAGDQVLQNLISGNYGAGVLVAPSAQNVILSQNAIATNGAGAAANGAAASGQLGIDLAASGDNPATGSSAYVTLNSTATGGANSLINYPILQTARLSGNTLVVAGLAAVGVTVELFLATPNSVGSPGTGNNFGQGSSFIGSAVLASSGATGSYGPGPVNGFAQGSGSGVNSFTLTIPLGGLTAAQRAALTASGALLTSTATLAGTGTSEFSGNVPVTTGPTAFNTTNLNVGANSAAMALNPGLTVPQAASDPASSIASFTVFPVANGTLLYGGAAIPASGQLVPAANAGQLTYQPASGFLGNDTFTFYATNAAGTVSNTATYTVPVVASNSFVANDDGLDLQQNTATPGNVVLNDTNPDNTTDFTATPVAGSGPSHGTLTLKADGSYVYTPASGYLGPDSFQYQICQPSAGCSNVATVSLNVYDAALACSAATGPDLLQNPGFEQGNAQFTSAYTYVSPKANAATIGGNTGLNPESTYAVDVDADAYHSGHAFTGLGHGGGGNFMLVNGAANQSKVYAQTVNVVPNRYYNFSGYAQSVNPSSPAVLGFVINGKSASSSTILSATVGQYVKFSGVWFSGSSRTATFEVRDINRTPLGNDFGLDDLYFGTCSVNLLAVDVTNAPGIPAQAPPTSIAAMAGTVTGSGAAVASFTIQTLPTAGTLRLGGPAGPVVAQGQTVPVDQRNALYYTPAAGFAGNAVFTYTANDTEGAGSSNIATYTIPVSSGPLPVALAAFTAKPVGPAAQLDWTTASELHNAYFAIERSSTCQATDFVAIGQVKGHGTVATASTYRYTDRNAAAMGQVVYYRLHQVDTDGTSTYSPVRAVSFGGVAQLSLYPNPTAGPGTTLDLSALPATATYQVRLLDATGRTARQWELAGGQAQPLAVSDLASGTYLLLVSGTQADGSPLRQVLHLTKE